MAEIEVNLQDIIEVRSRLRFLASDLSGTDGRVGALAQAFEDPRMRHVLTSFEKRWSGTRRILAMDIAAVNLGFYQFALLLEAADEHQRRVFDRSTGRIH